MRVSEISISMVTEGTTCYLCLRYSVLQANTPLYRPPMENDDRYLVPGLVRGLSVLQTFTADKPNQSLRDLANAVGITRSAIFRIVYTLDQLGFLTHQKSTQTYSLGPSVLRLGYGYLASRDLVQLALPQLQELRDRTGWSTHLGIREATEVVYLLRVPTLRGLGSIVHVGSRLPAHATTMGRALLADLSKDEISTLYRDTPLTTVNARTVTTIRGLWQLIREDRARGFVAHIGGFEEGIASAAAAIRDVTGQAIAAINVSAAASQTDASHMEKTIVPMMLETAAQLSRALGFDETGSHESNK